MQQNVSLDPWVPARAAPEEGLLHTEPGELPHGPSGTAVAVKMWKSSAHTGSREVNTEKKIHTFRHWYPNTQPSVHRLSYGTAS